MLTTTVIVPTYNRPAVLRDFVASLVKQTLPPDQFIVVDDGDLGGIPLAAE